MENTRSGLHNFHSSNELYIFPSCLEDDNETNRQSSKLFLMNINGLLNGKVNADDGYEANQSTEEGVPSWISDERVVDLTKSIMNRDGFKSLSLIQKITQPILLIYNNFLVELASDHGLDSVVVALWDHYSDYLPVATFSRRRVADG